MSTTAVRAADLTSSTDKAARGRRLRNWFQALPWAEMCHFLEQAAEDGLSEDDAIGAASIILDGAVDFKTTVDGPLGVWLERRDRKLAESGLRLAWRLVERRRAAKKASA
jgi:hypothetical protein